MFSEENRWQGPALASDLARPHIDPRIRRLDDACTLASVQVADAIKQAAWAGLDVATIAKWSTVPEDKVRLIIAEDQPVESADG